MSPFVRVVIGFTTLVVFIIIPLGIFIRRHRLKPNLFLYWAVLYPSWYLSNALFHEFSHYFINSITNVQILEARIIPHFWKGDFTNAFVRTGPQNPFQTLVGATAPYWISLVLMAAALSVLRSKPHLPPLAHALMLTLFCLRPAADIINNYTASLLFDFGDFTMVANAIGAPGMHGIAVAIILATCSGCIYALYGLPIDVATQPRDTAA